LALVERDLEACRTPRLVTDWRFNISYNAALQLATAAMAAVGRIFDTLCKKRNVAGYELANLFPSYFVCA